jgi:hypothetical protein
MLLVPILLGSTEKTPRRRLLDSDRALPTCHKAGKTEALLTLFAGHHPIAPRGEWRADYSSNHRRALMNSGMSACAEFVRTRTAR